MVSTRCEAVKLLSWMQDSTFWTIGFGALLSKLTLFFVGCTERQWHTMLYSKLHKEDTSRISSTASCICSRVITSQEQWRANRQADIWGSRDFGTRGCAGKSRGSVLFNGRRFVGPTFRPVARQEAGCGRFQRLGWEDPQTRRPAELFASSFDRSQVN